MEIDMPWAEHKGVVQGSLFEPARGERRPIPERVGCASSPWFADGCYEEAEAWQAVAAGSP